MKSLTPSREQALNWMVKESRQQWANSTDKTHLRVFKVENPVTIFLRGTKCNVTVQYHDLEQAEIHAKLYNAFGLRFVTEQDEAGVYIVVKRRRLLGWLARADCILKVPPYAHLAFNLTQGTIKLENMTGIVEIPPLKAHVPLSIPQVANPEYNRLVSGLE